MIPAPDKSLFARQELLQHVQKAEKVLAQKNNASALVSLSLSRSLACSRSRSLSRSLPLSLPLSLSVLYFTNLLTTLLHRKCISRINSHTSPHTHIHTHTHTQMLGTSFADITVMTPEDQFRNSARITIRGFVFLPEPRSGVSAVPV